MTNKEYVLETLKRSGKLAAQLIQDKSSEMTGTELNAETAYIPDFKSAIKNKNMLDRHAGMLDGFVCKSSAGRVVRLIQNYDSNVYMQEPEELPAQWAFVWSDNPTHALPFIALSTSPYQTGNCCTENGKIFRSKINDNVHAPSAYPQGWEQVVL